MGTRKIALPVANHKLADHFGRCQYFYIYKLDGSQIINRSEFKPPQHETGRFPAFMYEKGVDVVLAAGIGQKAIDSLTGLGITVLAGTTPAPAETIIKEYLNGSLKRGYNLCDH